MPSYKELLATALTKILNEWVIRETYASEDVPDFWDECNTSERLADYLANEIVEMNMRRTQ